MAGINAAIRAVDILVIAGLDVRLIKLPAGKDPDNIVRSESKEALRDILSTDLTFIQFRLKSADFSDRMNQTERLEAVRDLLATIKAVKDPLRQDAILTELSLETSIGRDTLDRVLANKVLSGQKPQRDDEAQPRQRMALSIEPESIPERDLIQTFLAHPILAEKYMNDLKPSQFRNNTMREIFLVFEQAFLDNRVLEPSQLPDKFNDPVVRSFIAEAVFSEGHITVERAQEAAVDCIRVMKKRDLFVKVKEMELKINDATREKKPTKELLRELVELRKEMNLVE